VVTVALVVIPLKVVMVRLSKDRAGEVETLLAIPEDVCYVTLGLLLSSITAPEGMSRLFRQMNFPRTDGALLIIENCRFAAIAVGLVFPFLLVAALFTVFAGQSGVALIPCPQGLEEAEALVERKRQIMFQNGPIQPTIARTWKRRYAMSLEMQARKVREISLEVKHLLATV
jgi:hypothetical protein